MKKSQHDTGSIERRHAFIGMVEDDCESIRNQRDTLAKALPDALDALYDQIRVTPEVGRFFSSENKIERAKQAQSNHWQSLLDAKFDHTYVEKVRSIGEIHAQIGLTPRWYIGAYTIILERLIRSIIEEGMGRRGVFSHSGSQKRLSKNITSLCKAVFTEIDLTVSFYLDAMELERSKLREEQEKRSHEDREVMAALKSALTALANGDLSYRVTEELPKHSEVLKEYFNTSAEQLTQSVTRIAQSTEQVISNAESIRHGADDLSQATEQQAAAQEEMSAAVTQITHAASETAKETTKALHMAATARSDAEQASKVATDAIEAIGRIEKSSHEISNIIVLINKISMQTNILSLNAGVEAARAGEFGRGFAVVASEIRALAERSAKASKEIAELITKAAADVMSGVTQVHTARESLDRITDQVININKIIRTIASASQTQSSGLNEVKVAISSLEQTTLKNAEIAEKSAKTAHKLVSMSDELSKDVSVFNVKNNYQRQDKKILSNNYEEDY